LLAITRHRPASIHELAVLVGRDYKNVSTDITLLERLRPGQPCVSNWQEKGADAVPYDKIHVTIDLRQPHEIRAA